ncbi:MAG: hypothetical protein ACUVWX_09380, partial [Kiritimatiellia bacterium]
MERLRRAAISFATTAIFICAVPQLVAGLHEKGAITLSLGGSLSHTASRNRHSRYTFEFVGDELRKIPSPSQGEDYSTFDASLYLSAGYFAINHLEVGLSASVMGSWRSENDENEFDVCDFLIYAKYFFDNATKLTPYAKLSGGRSHIRSGTYLEDDLKLAAGAGIEFFGTGPFTWYVEFSNEYTELGGDLGGNEWEQRLYVGVTYYFTGKAADKPSGSHSSAGTTPQDLLESENHLLESLQKIDERIY